MFRFGVFETDSEAGELRPQGLKIKLQEQPFQILVMLLERSGQVISREELRERLWGAGTFVDCHARSRSCGASRRLPSRKVTQR